MTSGSVFLALVPANPALAGVFNTPDTPVDYTLSDAVYHTVFTGSAATNADVSSAADFLLAPGTYDLILGSGAFGTSGVGFVTGGETVNGSQTFVVGEPPSAFSGSGSSSGETFYSEPSSSTNFTGRFFVTGGPAAAPEASTTVSLGVLLGLGGLGLMVQRRRVIGGK